MNKFHLSFLVLVGVLSLSYGFPQSRTISRYFVTPKDDATMQKVADLFAVDSRQGEGYEVLVPVPERQWLLGLAPDAKLLEEDISEVWKVRNGENLKGFHTFQTVKSDLDNIVAQYPDIATLDTYGKSMEGRPLYVLRLVTKNGQAQKPQVAITSSTHGNELITVEVGFGIVNALLKGYGRDKRLTAILDNYEIYYLPVINPDGYTRQQREANGVDPNREYPWPEVPNRNPNPCIKAVMEFFQTHNIKGSIDYHSTGGMIMYPWAYTYNSIPSADAQVLNQLTGKMAQSNGYTYGQISKVIYVAKGSSADYYYWKFKTHALGIEISRDGSSSLIPSMVQENLESTWTFIESFK